MNLEEEKKEDLLLDELKDPHDRLFKAVFSDSQEAASVLKHALPPAIASQLDWDSLRRADKEYIEEDFKKSSSDLLYEINLKTREHSLLVYVVWEHQSTPDRWMAFRMLKYRCRIWDDCFKNNKQLKQLPPIIPIVLYQGKQTWSYSNEFLDLLAPLDFLKAYFPQCQYILMDQSDFDTTQFQGNPNALIAQILMQSAFHGNLEKVVLLLEKLFPEILQTGGIDYSFLFIRYLLEIHQDQTEQIIKLVHPPLKETVMTQLQEYIQKGVQTQLEQHFEKLWEEHTEKGRQEEKLRQESLEKERQESLEKAQQESLEKGRQEEKFQTVKNLLSANCQWNLITQVTGITETQFQAWLDQKADC